MAFPYRDDFTRAVAAESDREYWKERTRQAEADRDELRENATTFHHELMTLLGHKEGEAVWGAGMIYHAVRKLVEPPQDTETSGPARTQ